MALSMTYIFVHITFYR